MKAPQALTHASLAVCGDEPCCQLLRGFHRAVLSLLLLTAILGSGVRAESYKRNESCSTDCTADTHTCTACDHDVKGPCPEGWTPDPAAQRQEVDEDKCDYTDCATGGCPDDRPHEQSSEVCWNSDLTQCHTGICRKEYCCATLLINKCCKQVNCTLAYDDCLVPEQLSKSDPSVSIVELKRLPHAATATFPFFKNLTVSSGQPCEKLWGSCSCWDGRLVPGCNASDSSTWTSLDQGTQPLPAALFTTCTAFQGCTVPQRGGAQGDGAVHWVTLPHGGEGSIPFYTSSRVPAGASCTALTGRCSCDDGRLRPGCDPLNSSTWWDSSSSGSGSGGANVSDLLAPGLYTTCTVEEAGGSSDEGRHKGLLVAGIVSAAVLGLGLLVALLWYFRSRLRFQRWSQLRLGSSYQPVLTGAPDRAAGFGGIGDVLGTFRTTKADTAAGAGTGAGGFLKLSKPPGNSNRSSKSKQSRDPSRPLPFPATPDDDVFTLEDLDHDHRDHYPVLPLSRRAEVELNTPSVSHQGHRPPAIDKQPLLAPPAAVASRHATAAAAPSTSHAPEVTRQVQLQDREADERDDDDDDDDAERGLIAAQVPGKQHRRGAR